MALVKHRRLAPVAGLKDLERHVFPVSRTVGTFSRAAAVADLQPQGRADLELPFGMPRFVNATTLKQMLKAKRSDVLLRRVGSQWEICDDSQRIDLRDASVEFRLGAIQIFS